MENETTLKNIVNIIKLNEVASIGLTNPKSVLFTKERKEALAMHLLDVNKLLLDIVDQNAKKKIMS